MTVGVIGSGSMGSGIAQVASTADCTVIVYDVSKEACELSQQKLDKILARLVEKERINSAKAESIKNNISYVDDLSQFKSCDLIIEAIIENIDIKKNVFTELSNIVSNDCILASNTSSLSITSLAAAVKNPERFIGLHFFNPAPLMKLVEIIPAIQTSQTTIQQSTEIITSWSKTTVLAKDTPGFIVNKVARPFYGEAIRILEEGITDVATIDWAMVELAGFRMGPFTLTDFIGHDVNYVVSETVFAAFYYDGRYKPSFTQKRLVEAGYFGRKSRKGFYDYTEGVAKPEPNKDMVLGQQIADRIIIMLINEAADTLHINIATKEDIDTAMTKGVNYPKGLFEWADEIGIQECVDRMDALYDEYHEERYRCSPLLRKMAKQKLTFYQNQIHA